MKSHRSCCEEDIPEQAVGKMRLDREGMKQEGMKRGQYKKDKH